MATKSTLMIMKDAPLCAAMNPTQAIRPEVLSTIYTAHYRYVLGICRRFFHQPEDAEDADESVEPEESVDPEELQSYAPGQILLALAAAARTGACGTASRAGEGAGSQNRRSNLSATRTPKADRTLCRHQLAGRWATLRHS